MNKVLEMIGFIVMMGSISCADTFDIGLCLILMGIAFIGFVVLMVGIYREEKEDEEIRNLRDFFNHIHDSDWHY